MTDYPDRPGYSFDPEAPPEVSRFLKNKGLRPSFSWMDVEPEEHAVAFTVAKAMEVDLLEAMKAEVQRAIDEGITFETFQRNWRANPRLAEWWGRKEMTDPLTGEVKDVQLGSPRRLKTIYRTNLRTARAAGQWERIERTKQLLPYLEYRLGPSERHRPHHQDKEGLILPVDHPFWDEWMPPNGWGCKCWVRQITAAEATRRGVSVAPDVKDKVWQNDRTGDRQIVPVGIDPGFQRNPGKLRQEQADAMMLGKIADASQAVARAAVQDILTTWRAARFLDEAVEGRLPVAVLDPSHAAAIGSATSIALMDARTIRKFAVDHPEVTKATLPLLTEIVETGTVQKQDATHLRFISRDDLPWVAVFEALADGRFLKLTTFFRFNRRRWKAEKRGNFEVLRE